MVSLLDIAPMKKIVEIRGNDIEVEGISADGLVHLLTTFPELQKLFAGRQIEQVELKSLIARFGYTVGEIIACGVGHQGDPEYIAFAMKALGVGEQTELLEAIIGLTFPKGIKSFLDGLSKAADSAGVLGKVPHMRSPAPSSASLQTDTEKPTSGE